MNERIKYIREINKLSQEEFGKRIGITKASVSRIESGVNNPSSQTLILICQEFGINKEWLESGEGDILNNLDATDILFSHVGELLGHSSPKKRAVLSALIEMAYHVPEEKWNYIFEQFQNCYKESLEDNKKKDG